MAEVDDLRCVYTEQERELIAFVRAHFGDRLTPRYSDPYIRRYIRARKFVKDDIITMLENDLVWRAEFRADTVMEWLPKEPWFEAAVKYWPGGDWGEDQFGNIPYWERTGLVDSKSMCAGLTVNQVEKLHVYLAERGELARRQGDLAKGREEGKWLDKECKNPIGLTVVMDANGLGLGHMYLPGLQLFKAVVTIDEAHYPSALRRVYLINAPKIAQALYKIIRPWLDEDTASKVVIISSSEDPLPKMREEFGNFIPDWLGGAGTDHGIESFADSSLANSKKERVVSIRQATRQAAKRYELLSRAITSWPGLFPFISLPKPRQVEVAARGTWTHDLKIERPTMVTWVFRPKEKDISFRLLKIKRSGKEKVLHSEEKATHWTSGSLVLRKGTYQLVFDNSFSWFSSKSLLYRLELTEDEAFTKAETETLVDA